MPIEPNGKAPYAPANAVLGVIERYRDHGLSVPFTRDVLERAGVQATLAPRTLQSLRRLDLIDDEGMPTQEFQEFHVAPSDEHRERFAAILRSVYAEVFQFADPAKDEPSRIADAFRKFEPTGQRERMVLLFYALCEYAGIVDSVPENARGAVNRMLKERAGSGKTTTRPKRQTPPATGQGPKVTPPDPPPPASSAKDRYLDLLLKQAEQGNADPDLLDRIERVLGVPPASPSTTNGGGEADS